MQNKSRTRWSHLFHLNEEKTAIVNKKETKECIINESIKLEINMAHFYSLFHDLFPDNDQFWQTLYLEERNHANLLHKIKNSFLNEREEYPEELFSISLNSLKSSNLFLKEFIKKYTKEPPSLQEACEISIHFESMAGEIHFDRFSNKSPTTDFEKLFSELNGDDKNHKQRIEQYLKKINTN